MHGCRDLGKAPARALGASVADDSDLFVLTLTPGQFVAWGPSVQARGSAGELLERFYITLPEL